ncbi:hypothetical protein FB45DRAFT_898099 [Roridomyces roridus]|uniref:Uncharacterized protein n=1 Tax=Roridomyces roridus TaxID=1738132 RepID=A0AAD7CBP5_9AGAR|nr:hypothetical protein FB45DRAFT_898099 [Roridomyces roridus]
MTSRCVSRWSFLFGFSLGPLPSIIPIGCIAIHRSSSVSIADPCRIVLTAQTPRARASVVRVVWMTSVCTGMPM